MMVGVGEGRGGGLSGGAVEREVVTTKCTIKRGASRIASSCLELPDKKKYRYLDPRSRVVIAIAIAIAMIFHHLPYFCPSPAHMPLSPSP